MNNHIVITGATGNTGQVVAAECQQRGAPFVAMARSASNREVLAEAGYETVHGDFDDPATLVDALTGAAKAYLVCTPDERLIERETAFIDAAKAAGVKHIVKCSAYLADVNGATQNLRSHGTIEQVLIESGLDYTIFRPTGYMQTFTLFGWEMVQKAGVLSLPLGNGGMPLVDVRDVAAVAVKALTEPGHEGQIYNVTGPESLTLYDIAAIMERALGRPVTYMPGNERELLRIMALFGVPETASEHALKIMRMQREHKLETVYTTQQELGLEPTDYAQFLDDLIAGRTGGGNSFQPPDTLLFKVISAVMPMVMRLRVALHRRSL